MQSLRDLLDEKKLVQKSITLSKKQRKIELTGINVEINSRIINPLMCIVFIICGFSLGFRNARVQGKKNLLWAIGTLIIYFSCYFTIMGHIVRNFPNYGEFYLFIPVVIVSIMSFFFYRKIDWV